MIRFYDANASKGLSHLENGYEDEHFHFVSQDEYVALVEQLKKDGYTVLSCSEEYYYMEINVQQVYF